VRRALVVSTVHPPDDPRLRFKLIPTLAGSWHVTFACRAPGPTSSEGFAVARLGGGRVRRDLAAARLLLGRSYDVASVHDPELLPAVVLAAVLGRRVVFDLHENLPAQLDSRPGWPAPVRRLAAAAARWLLRLTRRVARVTVAEEGYRDLFGGDVAVFPNYLPPLAVGPRPADPRGGVVYVGDGTEASGIDVALAAVASSEVSLGFDVIGRCAPALAAELTETARRQGVDLRLHGFLPLDRALRIVAGSVVAVSPLRDLPNYRHSLPTKILEYLAVGVPVVASDLPGTAAEVGGLPGVVLVEPANATALAAAIRSAASDPALREAARDHAGLVRSERAWPDADVAAYYDAAAR
jgi:glycosyltransferase involved in cell wall biosynthesis